MLQEHNLLAFFYFYLTQWYDVNTYLRRVFVSKVNYDISTIKFLNYMDDKKLGCKEQLVKLNILLHCYLEEPRGGGTWTLML